MKMNPEVKSKWLKALRSGYYTQAAGALRYTATVWGEDIAEEDYGKPTEEVQFCCLGVLCDIYIKEKSDPELGRWDGDAYAWGDDEAAPFIEEGHLPRHVIEWAGLEENDPTPVSALGNHLPSLSERNDEGKTFTQIANTIAKYF